MTGTLLNVGLVLAGASLGLLLGARLSEKVRTTAMQALGLVVLLIGAQMALQTQAVLVLLLSLVLGGVLGALIDIEERLERFGSALEARFSRGRDSPEGGGRPAEQRSRLVEAFVGSSLVFCVGPMAILGAIQDGLTGDFSTLAVKSVLDFFGAVVFASTLGPGVFLSAFTILVYQGSLTLAATWTRGALTEPMVLELTAAGGLMIVALGLRLLEIRRLPVANFLPGLLVAPVLMALVGPLLP